MRKLLDFGNRYAKESSWMSVVNPFQNGKVHNLLLT